MDFAAGICVCNVRNCHPEVAKVIQEQTEKVDVIVCAQGSMVPLLDELGETPIPVLTSPRLGVENAVRILNNFVWIPRYRRKIFAKGVKKYTEKILSYIPELDSDIEVVKFNV